MAMSCTAPMGLKCLPETIDGQHDRSTRCCSNGRDLRPETGVEADSGGADSETVATHEYVPRNQEPRSIVRRMPWVITEWPAGLGTHTARH